MIIRVAIILLLFITQTGLVTAQCPDWKKITDCLIGKTAQKKKPIKNRIAELCAYDQAITQCEAKVDSIHALLLQNLAVLYYEDQDYINSINRLKSAISISSQSKQNDRFLTKSYYLLSAFYKELNQDENSIIAADSCIAISIRSNTCNLFTLDALRERTRYSFNKGDYRRAYETARIGENSIGKYAIKDSESYRDYFSGWSVNALLALKDFTPAISLLQEKIQQNKSRKSGIDLSTCYAQLAQAACETGNITLAQKSFQQAYEHDLLSGNFLGCAQTLNNTGYYIQEKHYHNPDAAISFYNKAIQFLHRIENKTALHHFEMLNVYGNLANAYVQKNNFEKAFFYFKTGLDKLIPDGRENDFLQSNQVDSSYVQYIPALFIKKSEAYIQKYKAFKQEEDILEAIRLCRVTDQLLDRIKQGQAEEQSKLQWRKDTRSLYEHAIEACYLGNQAGTAFYFFEKSRAAILNDQLSEQQMLKGQDMLEVAGLKRKILLLERAAGASNSAAEDLDKQIYTQKQNLDELLRTIRQKNVLFNQASLDSNSVSLTALQNKLAQKTQSLLQLFSGNQAVYTLMITAGNVCLKKIDKNSFEEQSKNYISYLANPVLMNNRFSDFKKCSRQLYLLIFGGLPDPGARIIISTDGVHFPFESLVTSPAKTTEYFLSRHAVSYTYSARFFMNEFNTQPPEHNNNFMGMAPVQFPASFALSTLYGSDASLQKIAGNFSNTFNQVSTKASRWNFLQNFSRYSIIQLYTHASGTSIHNEPVIYFADSALYLSDLINDSKPVTQLVVLSACETGNGKDYTGEGVFSFNRGFAALGIPSAVANLWAVDNNATYQLTELFYKHLGRGEPTDIALQKAKLEYIQTGSRQQSLPYYWAAPVLVGKADIIALQPGSSFAWLNILTATAILILIVVVYKVYAANKRLKWSRKFTDRRVAGA